MKLNPNITSLLLFSSTVPVTVNPTLLAHDRHYGKHNAAFMEIEIARDLCDDMKVRSILHEVVERWNFEMDWDFEHDKINQIESCLFQFLTDNAEKLFIEQTT